jgi:hypothetical protein
MAHFKEITLSSGMQELKIILPNNSFCPGFKPVAIVLALFSQVLNAILDIPNMRFFHYPNKII